MAEILKIDGAKVKIGEDSGKVATVPIASLQFANPQVGDKVEVFRDGDDFIVKKADNAKDCHQDDKINTEDGERAVNKHVFVWVGNFLFGAFGVDRFLRGQVGLGILKICLNTIGWLTVIGGMAGGVWILIDWIISIVNAYGSAYGNTENITFDANGNYLK